MNYIKNMIIISMFVSCVMPQMLVGMTTREKSKVLADVSAFLKTDSAQWTDSAITTITGQINKLAKVEPGTAENFRAQLEGGKRLRDAIRIGQTQQQASQVELAAEKTRREQAEKSLVALRTQLQATGKDLEAVQTVQKKYDDEKQKNNPQISKNELERRRLVKELADQKNLSAQAIEQKAKQIADLDAEQKKLRAQLDKQAAELAEKTKQLSEREQVLLSQAQNLGNAQAESKQLKEDLAQIEKSRDKLAKISGDRFNSIIERNQENKELNAQLEKLRAEMLEKEASLRAQLNKSGLTEEEEKRIAAEIQIAQAAEKQYKSLLKQTRDSYEVLTQSLNEHLEELRGEIAHNSPILDEKIVAVNALQKEVEQLKAQAKQAPDKDKTEIEDLVKAKNEQQKLYEDVIANAKQEIKEQNEIIAQLEKEKGNIKEQKAQDAKVAQEELEKLQQALKTQQKEADTIQTQLQEINKKLAQGALKKTQQLNDQIASLNEQLERKQQEADAFAVRVSDSINSMSVEAGDMIRKLEAEKAELEEQLKKLQGQPQTEIVKQEIKRVQEERKETEEELRIAEKELSDEVDRYKNSINEKISSIKKSTSVGNEAAIITRARDYLGLYIQAVDASRINELKTKHKPTIELLQKMIDDAEAAFKQEQQKAAVETKRSEDKRDADKGNSADFMNQYAELDGMLNEAYFLINDKSFDRAKTRLNDAEKIYKKLEKTVSAMDQKQRDDGAKLIAQQKKDLENYTEYIKQATQESQPEIPEAPPAPNFDEATKIVEKTNTESVDPVLIQKAKKVVQESKKQLATLKAAYKFIPKNKRNEMRGQTLKFKIDQLQKSKDKLMQSINAVVSKQQSNKALLSRLQEIRSVVGEDEDDDNY